MYNAMEDETDDVVEALSDVRELLSENAEREFCAIVQRVVKHNSGWAWGGFWDMIHKNLVDPPCDASLRPPDARVHALIRRLLSRFEQRPEYPWLDERVHTATTACHAALHD